MLGKFSADDILKVGTTFHAKCPIGDKMREMSKTFFFWENLRKISVNNLSSGEFVQRAKFTRLCEKVYLNV